MARSLINTIQNPIASPSLLAGGSYGGEGSVGSWVGYRDNFTSAQAATLHIYSGLDGGIAVQDPATDLTATAQAAGNAGNNIFFDFDDSGFGLVVTTSVSANGDRRISVQHDGSSTNSAVVAAIQGNGTANGWVSVSTANPSGTFYPQNSTTYDISVGGRNFYLKAGCDANTPRTGAGASTNTVSVGTALSGTKPDQASGNGFLTSTITQSNQGISVPFTMPGVSQISPQSIRVKFKWYASRNLSGGAANATIFKCYLIDSDNSFQVYLGPLTDIFVGNQGSNTGFVNAVVPGSVLGFGSVALRSWSQNYRLAIHSTDTNFSLVISVDDVQISLDHGEVQDLRDLRVFNPIVNSGFDVWQRGTSFSTPASNTYTADRWVHEYDGTIGTFSISRQVFTVGQTNVPDEPQYYLQWNHTAAGSGSTFRRLSHRIEGVRQYAGKTVTLSFWAMSNAGFQSMSVRLLQNFGSGGSSSVTTASQGVSLNNGQWFRHTLTFQVPSISGKTIGTGDYLGIVFDVPLNQTFQLNLAQVMIAEGGSASQWRRAGNTMQQELALCQRFFEQSTRSLMGVIENGAAQFHAFWYFRTSKRVAPTMTGSSVTFTIRNQASGQSFSGAFNGVLTNTSGSDSTEMFQTDGATTGGFTNGNILYQDGGTITADAEIY